MSAAAGDDHAGVFVPQWAVKDCAGDTRDAMVWAQITWWLQPSQSNGAPRSPQILELDGHTWLYMTDERLAKEPGLSKDQVYRARLSLRKRGLIECRVRKIDGQRTTIIRSLRNRGSAVSETATSRNGQTATSRFSSNRGSAVSLPIGEVEPLESEETVVAQSAPTRTTKPAQATRIADEFLVTAEMRAWLADHCPQVDYREQTARFVDYWRAQPGQRGRKQDWVATWRNWMRRANDDRRPPQRRASGHEDNLAEMRVLRANG